MLKILQRRVQWTPQPIEPQKSSALFGLNFKCLLKIHSIDLHWVVNDLISFHMIQVSMKSNFWIDCVLWSHQVLSFTYHTYQVSNYMFKVNSKNPSIRYGICWKLTRKILEWLLDIVQLLLTWNISDILLYCFCCWLWAGKCQLPEQHSKYSRISNRKGGWSKGGGWQILAKIINGEGAINGDFGKNLQS